MIQNRYTINVTIYFCLKWFATVGEIKIAIQNQQETEDFEFRITYSFIFQRRFLTLEP